MSAVDILGLAVLSKHLEAADQYLNTLSPTLNGNNKKCFRYGNIYPDIPDSERIHINIPTYDIQIQLLIQGIPLAFITTLEFSTPQISREDFFAFLAENHLDQIPFVSDIKEFKKAIDEKKDWVKDGMYSMLPTWMQNIIDGGHSLERKFRNWVFDRVSPFFSYIPEELKQTAETHYGSTSYWHAMSTGRDSYNQETSFNNFQTELWKRCNSSTTGCECWKDRGFALHMLVDLTTESHAHISVSGGMTTVHYMHYFPYQDKALHEEKDETPDISSSITMFNKMIAGTPFDDIITKELNNSNYYSKTWYVGVN